MYHSPVVEGEPKFTDNEREDIGKAAIEAAGLGESFVWRLGHLKIQIWKLIILGGEKGVELDGVRCTPDQLRHDIDIVDEITRQSEALLQFSGDHTLNRIEERIEGIGWGSVFDPDSEISQRLKDNFGR